MVYLILLGSASIWAILEIWRNRITKALPSGSSQSASAIGGFHEPSYWRKAARKGICSVLIGYLKPIFFASLVFSALELYYMNNDSATSSSNMFQAELEQHISQLYSLVDTVNDFTSHYIAVGFAMLFVILAFFSVRKNGIKVLQFISLSSKRVGRLLLFMYVLASFSLLDGGFAHDMRHTLQSYQLRDARLKDAKTQIVMGLQDFANRARAVAYVQNEQIMKSISYYEDTAAGFQKLINSLPDSPYDNPLPPLAQAYDLEYDATNLIYGICNEVKTKEAWKGIESDEIGHTMARQDSALVKAKSDSLFGKGPHISDLIAEARYRAIYTGPMLAELDLSENQASDLKERIIRENNVVESITLKLSKTILFERMFELMTDPIKEYLAEVLKSFGPIGEIIGNYIGPDLQDKIDEEGAHLPDFVATLKNNPSQTDAVFLGMYKKYKAEDKFGVSNRVKRKKFTKFLSREYSIQQHLLAEQKPKEAVKIAPQPGQQTVAKQENISNSSTISSTPSNAAQSIYRQLPAETHYPTYTQPDVQVYIPQYVPIRPIVDPPIFHWNPFMY